jgi:SpoVK/Ycf46/Vps4 family AAA+-type ATPase
LADFQTQLANLLRARFPYIYVSTWEEERLLSIIRHIATDESLIKTPRTVITWRSTDGMVADNGSMKEKNLDPIKALDAIENYRQPAIFVLQDFHVALGAQGRVPESKLIRKIRDVSLVLRQSVEPKNVIIVAPTLVLPQELQKDVTILDFELPDFEEIDNLLKRMIQINKERSSVVFELTEDDTEKLARAAQGLTLQEAENAFAHAMVDDGRLSIDDVGVILEEKRQIVQKTGILEFIKPDVDMDDVGGLGNLKRWLQKRNGTWLESARKYCLPAPKGVLITGVPGCGKSLISKATSVMWQLPLLRLDMGKVFSGIVGSSEENMRHAIQTAEAVAPAVLWVDEIEKGFTGVGSMGDSGVTTRVFGTFLTWMQEKKKPVFVAATANQIHLLPPEFLRKGRFDEIFFVDIPTFNERKDILRIHMTKMLKDPQAVGSFVLDDKVLAELADLTEGFVGAELEQIAVTGMLEAFSQQRAVTLADFELSIKNTVPLSVTQEEQIKAIREWAKMRAVAATPSEDRAQYQTGEVGAEADVKTARGGREVDF